MAPEPLEAELSTEQAVAAVEQLSDAEKRLAADMQQLSTAFERGQMTARQYELAVATVSEMAMGNAKATLAAADAILARQRAEAAASAQAQASAAFEGQLAALRHQAAMDMLLDAQFAAAAEQELAVSTTAAGAASQGATVSFAQQKLMMRELVGSVEAATGAHSGLRGIIRMALNPEILALMAVMAAAGAALRAYRKDQEDSEKAIADSVKWVENYTRALEENKGKLLEFDEFQQRILVTGRALAEIHLSEEIEKQGKAVGDADAKYVALVNQLRAVEQGHKEGTVSADGYAAASARLHEKIHKAFEVLGATHERLEALTRAFKAGYDSVEEYQRSVDHWGQVLAKASDITNHVTPATRHLWEEQKLLADEFNRGAISIEEFTRRAAALQVIYQQESEKGAKAFVRANDEKLQAQRHFEDVMAAGDDRRQNRIELTYSRDREEFDKLLRHHLISKQQHDAAILKLEADRDRDLSALRAAEAKDMADKFERALKKEEASALQHYKRLQNLDEQFQHIETERYKKALREKEKAQRTYEQHVRQMQQQTWSAAGGLLGKYGQQYSQVFNSIKQIYGMYRAYEQAEEAKAAAEKAALAAKALASNLSSGEQQTHAYSLNAMSSVAAIPFWGWAAAPEVGAAAMAVGQGIVAAMAAAGTTGFSHGGDDNTVTGTRNLIGGEMVLDPMAGMKARRLVDMAESGMGGGGGGGKALEIHIHAAGIVGEKSVKKMIGRAVQEARIYNVKV